MKIITHPRQLFALSAVTLLTLGACSQHSSQTDSASAAASAPVAAASSPTEPTAAASSPAPSQPASASTAQDQPDEADENGDATPQPKPQPPQASANVNGPRIKGIALGESPEEVHQALSALLPVGNPCQVNPDATEVDCENTVQRFQARFTYESGKLSSFKFYAALTSLAFGQMPFKDFVQNFMNAYGVPRMEPAQDNPALSQYLRYRDDSGWEVGIYPDNTFYVKSVATSAQQAKSFN